MKRRIPYLSALAFIAVLAAACTPGGGSIYYTIETEPIVTDSTLPNAITVSDVAKMGPTYYVGAGKIWTGTATGAGTTSDPRIITWDIEEPLPVRPPSNTALCTGLVVSPFGGGTTLYGAFYDDASGGATGLYESTTVPSFAGQGAETLPAAGSQVALLKVENDGADRLIAVTTRQPTMGAAFVFDIAYAASAGSYVAATFDATRVADEEKKPINDVIYAAGAINAWFATEGSTLYTNAGPGFAGDFTKAGMTGIGADEVLTGLFFDGTRLYLASRAGKIYHSTNGTSWTAIPAPQISGVHPPLLRFAGPIGAGVLLVGSDGYGYYLLDTIDLVTDPLTRCTTTTIDLHTDTVRSFVLDPVEGFGFALTSMGGLWRGTVSGGDITGWGQE
jgi:hypothetical protein